MGTGIGEAGIGEVMKCLSKLERETARLYLALHDKCGGEASAILLFIAMDSSKHSGLLSQLAGRAGQASKTRCIKLLGKSFEETYNLVRNLRKKIEEKQSLGKTELIEILENMTDYEKSIGEEYLMLLYSKTLSLLPQYREEARVLELIAEDEERHVKLVEEALKLIIRKPGKSNKT